MKEMGRALLDRGVGLGLEFSRVFKAAVPGSQDLFSFSFAGAGVCAAWRAARS
jgi:hypothetical protein